MPPRELSIGVAVIFAQVLYSYVYPFVQEGLQSLATEAEVAINEIRDLSGTLKPSDSSRKKPNGVPQEQQRKEKRKDNKRASRDNLIEQALEQRMFPDMQSTFSALKTKSRVTISSRQGVEFAWDVHRVAADANTPWDTPWAYLVRLRVKNVSPYPCDLQSIARWYAWRAPDGKVSYIHRITEGPVRYTVKSGEEYKYASIWLMKYKTVELAGGLLLENTTRDDYGLEHRFLNTTNKFLQPSKSKEIDHDEVQVLAQNYHWMGVADFRTVPYF